MAEVQSTSDERTVNNTMRHAYRVLSDDEKAAMQEVKDMGLSFHNRIAALGNSREVSLAKTKVEEAVMWAVKHIYRLTMATPTIAPLYVSRPVVNAADIIAWAKGQGFGSTIEADDLHVTVAYSRAAIMWPGQGEKDTLTVPAADDRAMKAFGEKGDAIVLSFASEPLARRWQAFREIGATWDHPSYSPHITISYAAGDVELEKVEPYAGPIVLGPEHLEPINEDWKAGVVEKHGLILKSALDEDQRMVWGWASVITEKGAPVVDTQGDVIDADELVKATTAFMADARVAKSMHEGEGVGEVLHSFPLTTDLAKGLGIQTDREGWLVGVKVHDDAIWKRVKSGELAAFSIGGAATRTPITD